MIEAGNTFKEVHLEKACQKLNKVIETFKEEYEVEKEPVDADLTSPAAEMIQIYEKDLLDLPA